MNGAGDLVNNLSGLQKHRDKFESFYFCSLTRKNVELGSKNVLSVHKRFDCCR